MDGSSLRLASRLYAALLRTLPSPLLRRHEAEIRTAFEIRARAAQRKHGLAGVASVLIGAGIDVLVHAWRSAPQSDPGRSEMAGAMLGDLRLGARNLMRRPAFTAVAVFTLAIGIGAAVGTFAVVRSVLLRPLPFPDADRIVWISHHAPGMGMPDLANSSGTLALYRDQAKSFAHIASVRNARRNIVEGAAPERIDVAVVSPSLFDVLQVAPVAGRRLVAADAVPGAPPVAVLTHAGWLAHFAGSPAVIGRTIELDGVTAEIVGLMPQGFAYPRPSTRMLLPQVDEPPSFGPFGLLVIARLSPETDLAAARTELDALQARIQEAYPLQADMFSNAGWSVSVRPLQEIAVGSVAPLLWIALATVGFLLLVACASVANLLLVRGESRRREFGVRLALGATRGRIASALLSESVLVGLLGGCIGVMLAVYAVRALVASGSPHLPRVHEIGFDLTVLASAALISVIAGLVLGLLPVLQQLRAGSSAIGRGGRAEVGDRDRQRVRRGLSVVQLALALVLLTGSSLMLRSVGALRAVDTGLKADSVLVVSISASSPSDTVRTNARYLQMLHAVRGVGGVQVAGFTTALPLGGGSLNASSVEVEPRSSVGRELPEVVWYEAVSDGYFAAAGTGLRVGRVLTPEDISRRRPVVVVNERFVATVLARDAIGHRIRIGADTTWYEIVGVVEDVRAFGLREDARPMAYLPITAPHWTAPIQTIHLLLRTHLAPEMFVQPARTAVRNVDPNAPVLAARTLQAIVDGSMTEVAFTATVLSLAAVLALLLGAVGLYGVISYAVAGRRSEIGLRVALGASPASVAAMVLREGVILGAIGVGCGLAGAYLLTRFLQSVLFEVSVHDPLTFVVVPGVLLLVALTAAWLPARRAARVDPLEAMREAA